MAEAVVHGIDRASEEHLCGSRYGVGTDARNPSMEITCPMCRLACGAVAEPMPVWRISAQVIGGAVVITVDPRTAVTMAEAFAEYHRDQPAGDERRYWSAEVDHLVEVAVRAAQVESTRVDVPLVRMAPTSTAGTECERGPCFLGYGHEGDCKPVRAVSS